MISIRALYEHFKRHPRIEIDSRKVSPGCIFFAIKGDRFDGHDFVEEALEKGAVLAVVHKQIFKDRENVWITTDTLITLQDLASYHRAQFSIPVIGITGSNGKTTSKEMMATVLSSHYRTHYTQGNFNNHIGVPLTLLKMPEDTEVAIIEMGANHVGEIEILSRIASPTHGLITNIGAAHLEGFGGIEGVKKGKSELYKYLAGTGGVAIINRDEKYLEDLAAANTKKVFYCASDKPDPGIAPYECVLIAQDPFIKVGFLDEGSQLRICSTQLTGLYNFANIMTAITIGRYFKVPAKQIVESIARFLPANQRSQWMDWEGHKVLVDCYNANPTSMAAVLDYFKDLEGSKVAILGDMLELGVVSEEAHRNIALQALDGGIDKVVLVGPIFSSLNITGADVFASIEEVKENWSQIKPDSSLILLKGSRGIALEQFLN